MSLGHDETFVSAVGGNASVVDKGDMIVEKKEVEKSEHRFIR